MTETLTKNKCDLVEILIFNQRELVSWDLVVKDSVTYKVYISQETLSEGDLGVWFHVCGS